ncbi:cyclase family protein [Paenibacillus protaetiae]|uniref:Cyclase family protein n=1 Tax=Paenibacillus protaetiae TaxID=2509456 RepID=A0A4V0YEZ0_9BACL|nr:cyclase family protein [Paenibacillus protaetiae]QAY65881.1 cyclase family protein [Paenibacillus protaetiae]
MIIDLTHPIRDGLPPYPGDAETSLVHSKQYAKDYYNNHYLSINMHAGTHIDGPMHLTDCYTYMDEFPPDRFIGEGCLLDVSGQDVIDYKETYEQQIGQNQIVLIHTGQSQRFGEPDYFEHHPVLTEAFAALLVRKQVKLVGLDTPSPDKYPFAVHKHLFQNGILIAENLTNLVKLIDAVSFEVIALPLLIRADSSIARVIARIRS